MSWLRFRDRISPAPGSAFENLKIALVADDLTRTALSHECQITDITPRNFRRVLSQWKPDFLLVEATWRGYKDSWRYRIASYPDHPKRNNDALRKLVDFARELSIPAIFWNREDGVHFDRFIASARLFDRVLTVDENMIPSYRAALGSDAKLGTLMFAASNQLHFATFEEPLQRSVFVGSYSTNIHDRRRAWQDLAFEAARPLGLTVYDRNSKRRAAHYRYPGYPWIEVRPAVRHDLTPSIYRSHLVNLNVNTITDSATAFSRRLVEVLSCGGFVLSNETKAVSTHFAEFCLASDDPECLNEFFAVTAKHGLSNQYEAMRRAAADHVSRHHSWKNRLPILIDMAQAGT